MGNLGTIVCDLDGVLYRGSEPVAGAGDALDRVSTAGFRLLFATNNATRTADEVAAAIRVRTGHAVAPEQVVTSAMATAHHLAGTVGGVFVVGGRGLGATLVAAGVPVVVDWRGTDCVVVGLDVELTYAKLADATLAVRAGARLVASNDDATYPAPHGLVPGAGAIVAAVERATGATAEVCGKPHLPMRWLISELAGDGPVVVVGDRIETDVALGQAEGWVTVLTLTGVTTPEEAASAGADHVVASIADLPAILGFSGPSGLSA